MIKYIQELKYWIYFISLNFLTVLSVSYTYKDILLFIFIKPKQINKFNFEIFLSYFIFTSITDIFLIYMKIVFLTTIQLTILYFYYQVFIFISYALFKSEYFVYRNIFVLVTCNWFCSILILNHFLIPLSRNFFFDFTNFISLNFVKLHFEPRLNEYVNFCVFLHYSNLIYCQCFISLFFIFYFFEKTILITKQQRKLYYFLFIIFSTIFSPPDILSQFFLSLFLISFFEITLFFFLFKTISYLT